MAGHLLVYSRVNVIEEINVDKGVKLSTAQYNAGAKQIKANDVIFVGVGAGNEITLWLIAKARTGVIKTAQGNSMVRLKSLRLKSEKTCYRLVDGIVFDTTFHKGKWKLLDQQEVAACFFDTNAYNAQVKKQAIAVPAGFGIDSQTVRSSILLNTSREHGSGSVKEHYNASVALDEQLFRDALRRRLSHLDGFAFEHLVKELFQLPVFGFTSASTTKHTRDHGVDVVLTRVDQALGNDITIVQCKRLQPTDAVGITDAQILKSDMERHNANRGLLVTNTHFSPGAIKFASGLGVMRLIDGASLIDLLFRYAGQIPELWHRTSSPKQGVLPVGK